MSKDSGKLCPRQYSSVSTEQSEDNLWILLLHHRFCQLSCFEKGNIRLMEFNRVRERLTEHFIGAEMNKREAEAPLK